MTLTPCVCGGVYSGGQAGGPTRSHVTLSINLQYVSLCYPRNKRKTSDDNLIVIVSFSILRVRKRSQHLLTMKDGNNYDSGGGLAGHYMGT